jgi:hypothetical protein
MVSVQIAAPVEDAEMLLLLATADERGQKLESIAAVIVRRRLRFGRRRQPLGP